ncbi:MAG TPA: Hsp20/alpha crystallin family protein [Candidatus Dormibacteraeota bacterium]|nr:Hsp20/alpha crystallin family protein [Candidatus Dormibacteraeota bacterium]
MATMTTTATPKDQRDKTASRAPGPRDPRDTADRAPRAIPPRVDIYETEKIYVLLADMPGVLPDGLDVVAERDELVIRGRVERPARTPDYQEFELANYYRAFTLTDDLDTDGITARLSDGVLRVEIPKSARTVFKKIPVRME